MAGFSEFVMLRFMDYLKNEQDLSGVSPPAEDLEGKALQEQLPAGYKSALVDFALQLVDSAKEDPEKAERDLVQAFSKYKTGTLKNLVNRKDSSEPIQPVEKPEDIASPAADLPANFQ